MKPAVALGVVVAVGALPVHVVAHQFAPHICGDKAGSPLSMEHVDEFSKDLVMYHTDHEQFILLSCESRKAVVISEYRDVSNLRLLKEKVTKMQCSDEAISLEDVRDKFALEGMDVAIARRGIGGKNPFRCICNEAEMGSHRKTLWEITEKHGLVPTSETVSARVEC
ncbi:hypothetical protein SAMN04488118_10584 [Epibacterium ulvae]|uniref:Uncharacterized protein n=1 Tax=Epibacterium ulvae TaxID=1156985 RepID=A0A1G5QNZ3_9RHOB|nr:hypothetical protein [Epibacterium ulvae]SCZ63555.1 hypothetical protein SAMN04488118_10584 [Epibacterium ulvae]